MTCLIGEASPTFVGMAVFARTGRRSAACRNTGSCDKPGRCIWPALFVRDIDDRECPGERRADVGELNPPIAAFADRAVSVSCFGRSSSGLFGLRHVPLADADEQLLVVGRDGQRRGIPAGGNEALDWLLRGSSISMTATQLLSALAT